MERLGIPAAIVATAAYAQLGQRTAANLGLVGIPMAVIPHPFDQLPLAQVKERAQLAHPEVVRILTGNAADLEREFATKAWLTPEEAAVTCTLYGAGKGGTTR